MKRTINSTGRRSLHRDHVVLRVHAGQGGDPPCFSAKFHNLSELKLPPEARLYVEPYAGSSHMRFAFGTVGLPIEPPDTSLTDLDAGQSVLFDVKVVDETDSIGRLLASARHMRPDAEKDSDEDRRSLLPVELEDLGELLWKLDAPEGARPRLVLNSRVPGLLGRLRSDPLVQGCILPAAIAIILSRVLDPESGEDDETDWVRDWKDWILETSGDEFDALEDPSERERVVERLCAAHAASIRFATLAGQALALEPEVSTDE